MKTPILLNPAAGGGSAGRRWPRIEALLRSRGAPFELYRTTAPGDARRIAREIGGTVERLVLVGGDGTVNEVVNGLMECREDGATPAPFGVLPATTGNDFARSVGIPIRPEDAVDYLLAARPASLDVGRVDYEIDGKPAVRYFALACHTGLAAEVGERVNRGSKRWGGTVPFLSALLRMVVGYRGCRLRVIEDGAVVWEGPCLAAVVANGERLGGGMRMAPGATIDDGALDFVGFGDFTLAKRLFYLPRIYPGTHVKVPGVVQRRIRSVRLEADRPTLLNTDGETIGLLPAVVSVLPGALRVLMKG